MVLVSYIQTTLLLNSGVLYLLYASVTVPLVRCHAGRV
jgi:hypothetical protein